MRETLWRPSEASQVPIGPESGPPGAEPAIRNENEIPINDLIDIGPFRTKSKNEKALFPEKRRITQHETTIEVVVDKQLSRAGVDLLNKLIDRDSEDNLVRIKNGSFGTTSLLLISDPASRFHCHPEAEGQFAFPISE